MARGEGFGSARVGSRLATGNTSGGQQKQVIQSEQPKIRNNAKTKLSVPNRSSLSTTASEPSGTMRLLPQRRVQKGAFRKGWVELSFLLTVLSVSLKTARNRAVIAAYWLGHTLAHTSASAMSPTHIHIVVVYLGTKAFLCVRVLPRLFLICTHVKRK